MMSVIVGGGEGKRKRRYDEGESVCVMLERGRERYTKEGIENRDKER